LELTRRVRIATGLLCNLHCRFCYYNEELNKQSYSTQQIRDMLTDARKLGIRDIDFSGGEPTLRDDLPELLTLARDLGFRRICVITNATRTHRRDYLEQLRDAGLNEVLVSLHGHDPETHDLAVDRQGSFAKVEASLDNIGALGLRLRVNTVVNRFNAEMLPELARSIASYQPVAANFICFNDWVNASPVIREIAVRYSDVQQALHAAIDVLSPAVSKVTVRYIPFCFMAGYEKHVCGLLQNDYDDDEWNDAVKRIVTDRDPERIRGYQELLGEVYRQYRVKLEAEVLSPQEVALIGKQGLAHNPFASLRPELVGAAHRVENFAKRLEYVKGEACRSCSQALICDGLEPAYADWHGTSELQAFDGEPISDPMFHRRAYALTWR
jgi:uncharacterized Fe-S cluster-containing radical SAM superfamily protein